MAAIPDGFALCATALAHSTVVRPAFITYGVSSAFFSDDVALANAVQTATYNALKALIDTNVTFGPTTVRVGHGAAEPTVGVSTGVPPLGTRAGTSPSPNVAILCSKLTSRGGRRGRGRTYLPWAVSTTDIQESGALISAWVTTVNTALASWKSGLAAASIPMVLLHSEGESPAGAPNEVTSMVCSPLVGTQRRRMGR